MLFRRHPPSKPKIITRRMATLAALVLALSACSAIRRGLVLPSPDEGARRELGRRAASRICLLRKSCPQNVRVGEERLQVETRVRRLPLRELPGYRGSVAGRAAGATAGWMVRQLGATTMEETVYTGTRAVTGAAEGRWRTTCDLAWIDQVTTGRHEESTPVVRMAEGLDCRVTAAPDTTVVLWRFRRGMTPTPDSIARVLGTLPWADGPNRGLVLPMSLERFGDAPRDAGDYAIAEDTIRSFWPSRPGPWRVTRADGARIASLHEGGGGLNANVIFSLDLNAASTAEEAAALRLIAVAAMWPIDYPP